MDKKMHFQWQNDFLCKTIYPMRKYKLIDVLVYYHEIDLWKEYGAKSAASLQADIDEYKKGQELASIAAYKVYSSMRGYFMTADARGFYLKFKPVDETELAEINKLHALFVSYWPKDIRGERPFVQQQTANWVKHRDQIKVNIENRRRRLSAMAVDHPKYAPETQELKTWETITLPMAEQELDQLRAFDDTYDQIEKPKLEWYRLTKSDPNFKTPEAEFLVRYSPAKAPTAREIAIWKSSVYRASLEKKTQFELLQDIQQRFQKEPNRFPAWLQYMIVHFSGMRYASAHGSWADPRDLLVQLRLVEIDKEVKAVVDNAEAARLCDELVAKYEGAGTRSGLAASTEKVWRDRVARHMQSLKSAGISYRRIGLAGLRAEEVRYEYMTMPTEAALTKLESMKSSFPQWAWKEIVRLTQLRVNHVNDLNWEKLTPEEEAEKNSQKWSELRTIINGWKNKHIGAWRDEHGRSHELIVARAVCNETAEHIQHLRGHLVPGGLTAKPIWYRKSEKENLIPGAKFIKPKEAGHYTQGASILWLSFVHKQPDIWQIAETIETEDKEGLIPKGFIGRKPRDKNDRPWTYKIGGTVTRSRSYTNENKVRVNEQQWLRWLHEATVVEIAETAEGQMMLTFETARPNDDKATSCIGVFIKPLAWYLAPDSEENFNRSFVGYVPEGKVPHEHLKSMLDWNKILLK